MSFVNTTASSFKVTFDAGAIEKAITAIMITNSITDAAGWSTFINGLSAAAIDAAVKQFLVGCVSITANTP